MSEDGLENVVVVPEETPPRRSSLTAVENIYFRQPGENPKHYATSFTRQVESDEEPYSRRFKVTKKHETLDFGWVRDVGVGMFLLENLGPPPLQFNPSPEEKVEPKDLAIHLYLINSESWARWLIPVGESSRFNPGFDVNGPYDNPVRVYCKGGTVRCVVHALPK